MNELIALTFAWALALPTAGDVPRPIQGLMATHAQCEEARQSLNAALKLQRNIPVQCQQVRIQRVTAPAPATVHNPQLGVPAVLQPQKTPVYFIQRSSLNVMGQPVDVIEGYIITKE